MPSSPGQTPPHSRRGPLLRCPWNAGEIKRRPEVETLLLTGDNHIDAMRKVLKLLTEGGKLRRLLGSYTTGLVSNNFEAKLLFCAYPYFSFQTLIFNPCL